MFPFYETWFLASLLFVFAVWLASYRRRSLDTNLPHPLPPSARPAPERSSESLSTLAGRTVETESMRRPEVDTMQMKKLARQK